MGGDAASLAGAARPRPGAVPWLRVVGHELAPFAGRGRTTARITLACSLAAVLTLTIQVPFLEWLPLYLCFALTKETKADTVLTGVGVMVAVVGAVFLALASLRWFAEPAWLRMAVLAGYLFTAFLAGRVAEPLQDMAHDFGIVMAIVMTFPDILPYPDEWGRAAFWCIPIVMIGAGSSIVATLLLPPQDPWDGLRAELDRRLARVQAALSGGGHAEANQARPLFPADLSRLEELKAQAMMQHPSLKRAAWSLDGVLAQVDRLASLAAALVRAHPGPLPPADRDQAQGLARACAHARQALARGEVPRLAPHLDTGAEPQPGGGASPLLFEMAQAMARLDQAFAGPGDPAPGLPGPSDLGPALAALADPVNLRFALKGTLAALGCYFIYTALGFQQVHTALVTCLIVALSTQGAVTHKIVLRITGASTGALMAMAFTIWVIPQLTSVFGFVLLLAAGTSVGAWVAAGSQRVAYAGWQIALAIFMMLLHGQGPSTDFSVLDDRLLGILLGNVMMGLVFTMVWPDRASAAMWRRLGGAIGSMAAMARVPLGEASPAGQQASAARLRRAWNKDMDQAARSLEQAVFEVDAFTEPGRLAREEARGLMDRARGAMPLLESVTVYGDQATLERVPAGLEQAVRTYHANLGAALEAVAARLEGRDIPSGLGRELEQGADLVAERMDALEDEGLRQSLAAHRRLYMDLAQRTAELLGRVRSLPARTWGMGGGHEG